MKNHVLLQYLNVLRLKNMYGYLFPGPPLIDFFTLYVASKSTVGLACHCILLNSHFFISPVLFSYPSILFMLHTLETCCTLETFFYYDSAIFHDKGVKQFRKWEILESLKTTARVWAEELILVI